MSEDVLDDEEEYSKDADDSNDTQVQTVKKDKRYMPPSSAGFSFFITGKKIKLRVYYKATSWKKINDKPQSWQKSQLADDGKEVEFTPDGKTQYKIFEDKAKIYTLWRKHRDGYIVTLTLSNQQTIADDLNGREFNQQRNEKTLFEVEFKCIVASGVVAEYPAIEKSLLSEEEREIELRYQDLKIYAVGHGVAANWQKNKHGNKEIWADFMPQVEVPQVTADTGGKNDTVLAFNFLRQTNQKEVPDELSAFIQNYNHWNQEQETQAEQETDKEIANEIVKKQKIAQQRMEQGVELLRKDNDAKIAFALMNKAMLMQWISTDKNKNITQKVEKYKWRPFQLGFILMVLQSSIDENDDYRDTLDLIWFPTGGGKTEAYLGLMAFLFIYRRLTNTASGSGTVAIMRYTLRLLTTQQFMRANKVIFALELIRRQGNYQLGQTSFSSGLWVGQATSPNTFKQAKGFITEGKFDKFVLNYCPWCDTKFKPENYHITEDDFYFSCANHHCDFGKDTGSALPCNVVDEVLYKNPPSLLLATVDKFAGLAWESRASKFFGGKNNKPPELIIQDELHLISDALGSIVGLYEVGIEAALISRGARVKYIASTATIKNASQQVKTLFAKETAIFPPSGLRYDDSYFAKTVPLTEKPGRLYVGYLATMLDRQHCLVPLAVTLLSAPIHLFKDDEKYLDNWWTQIIYHGSLKGLNNSSTLYQNNINSKLKTMTLEHLKNAIDEVSPHFCDDENIKTPADFEKITVPEIKQIVGKYLSIRELKTKELSSKKSAQENAQIFNALALEKNQVESVDVALATNMVATGLDVPRLALMVINGQPLTTAEYIQASSRVGRGDVPGIVFTNYYKTQARSLSHYENFRSYHDSFYRFVEPSSVTPFTYQARKKALHAALIITIRHSNINLLDNSSAKEFNKDSDKVKQVIKEMKLRCQNAINNDEVKNQTFTYLDELLNEWQNEVDRCKQNKIKMVYYSTDRGSQNLICNFDKENGLWQTMQAMRNVENSALIKLITGLKQMKNKQKYTPVRFSHLTSYSGVGAIVRGAEDKLMVIKDITHWTDKNGENASTPIPYVDRITQALGINKELRMPPLAKKDLNKGIEGSYLPAVLFPTYAVCKKCGLLHNNPWRVQNKKLDEKVDCEECNTQLEQVVWCFVSNEGYLDDVPWHYICHKNTQSKCEADYQASYLKLTTKSDGKKMISCTRCSSDNLYEKQQLGFISKKQPWIYGIQPELGKNKRVDIVEVNSASAYLPERVNALVIPPESRISKATVVDKLYNNSTALRELDQGKSPAIKKSKLNALKTKYRCTFEEINKAISQINNGYPNFGKISTSGDLIADEYQAFLTPLEDVKEDEDFVTEHKTKTWKNLDKTMTEENLPALIKIVDKHIIAKRLREILVFKGFKRGIPQDGKQQLLVPPDITGESYWLPAIELFGEGVFFTLDEALLSRWEQIPAVRKRAGKISQLYEKSSLNLEDDIVISPRFILLHTLAHLMMRELESTAGYPAASLSERIYHSRDKKMAGILIYTAVADIVGSLGGIVESSQPKQFLKLLNGAFKHAQWCSLDPVCTEHQGQGPCWLNRAACHGCVLVPETACQYSNVFLDRVFIKGDKEGIPNFLEFVGDNNG